MRGVWRCWAAGFATIAVSAAAAASPFPNRTVAFVVGSAGGGGIDTMARLVAEPLSQLIGQPVIVETRPGAGNRIALDYVANAAPDGHTLLVTTSSSAIDTAFQQLSKAVSRPDVIPVALIASTSLVLVVNPKVPVSDVNDLVARARMMPGVLNYASSGPGTTGHLYGELFKQRTATDIVHIPYKGTAPAVKAVIAGEVDMAFATLPAILPFVKAGRLRALAVIDSRRSKLLPDVPTIAEAGLRDAEASVWYGVLAPPGTPPAIVDAIAQAIATVTSTSQFHERLSDLGAEPREAGPAQFATLLRNETARWKDVISAAGLAVQK